MSTATLLELPWPPSVNHYWRRVGHRIVLSREGRDYRRRIQRLLADRGIPPLRGRLDVSIVLHPPDRRAFDIDNRPKGLLDALEHAGVYANDNQIDRLVIQRREIVQGGMVIVHIEEKTCANRDVPSPACVKRN